MSAPQRTAADVLRQAMPPARRIWPALASGFASEASAVALLAVSAWLIVRASEQPPVLYLTAAVVGVRFFAISRAVFRYLERLTGHDAALRRLAVARSSLVRRLVPLAILFVFAAGCSSSRPYDHKVVKPLPSTVIGTVPKAQTVTVPAKYKNGDPVAGKHVFLTAGCTGCHTLKDAGSTGTVGPNLDQAKPALSLAVERVTHGAGAMPNFSGQLSTKQIADVTAYVVKASGGNPNG